ncbi:hypothetical protein B2G51_02245 [Leptospira santarosai]|nr:hypothetical protein B2G51_02245 [Leptospira santarosai]OLY60441.1 hypothetical protein BV917_11395 [Leptospira santarosai serovar Guaricura]
MHISSLITDLYSRKIVGFKSHDFLEFEGYINSLNRAFAQIPKDYSSFRSFVRRITQIFYSTWATESAA